MKTKTPSSNASPRLFLRLAPALIVAALVACCPLPTRANTIALSFTGGSKSGGNGDTVGWAFTLSSPVLLTDLGLWDPNGGTGLNDSHLVTVWTSTGTQVPGAQTTIPSGPGPETAGFRYVSIAPVLLSAGSYTIGAFYPGNAFDAVSFSASTITTASGVTYNGSRGISGNAFPPTDFASLPNSYFGPNFQFTAPPANGVPDSGSTWTLLLLGLTATFGLKFFVRRPA
jgi:hypothetical protein